MLYNNFQNKYCWYYVWHLWIVGTSLQKWSACFCYDWHRFSHDLFEQKNKLIIWFEMMTFMFISSKTKTFFHWKNMALQTDMTHDWDDQNNLTGGMWYNSFNGCIIGSINLGLIWTVSTVAYSSSPLIQSSLHFVLIYIIKFCVSNELFVVTSCFTPARIPF